MIKKKKKYCSGLPFLSPGDLPNPGIEPSSPVYPALLVDSLLLSYQGSSFILVQFSSAMSDSLQPHEPQHTRLSCPSPTPGVYCPLSR